MLYATRAIVVATLLLALAACQSPLTQCSTDADCEGGAVCLYAFCVTAPRPRVIVAADRKEASVGEAVHLDASASIAPDGKPLAFEFRADPEDAASIEANGARATVRLVVPHQDVEVIVTARAASGAEAEERVTIAARNARPTVRLETNPDPFEPGATVTIVAVTSDADGDELTWEWSFEGVVGQLDANGDRAVLHSSPADEAAYSIGVVVRDGHGGEASASTVLTPRNAAPRIEVEEASAGHQCTGDPATCISSIVLPVAIEDAGNLDIRFRLLNPREGVDHKFIEKPLGGYTLDLVCTPACAIAGSYLVEVKAVDDLGASTTREFEVVVGNRSPILSAHDGSELPHRNASVGAVPLYSIVRPAGSVVVYFDPDGDPPLAESVQWTSASEIVEFSDSHVIDPSITAVGTFDQLFDLEVSIVAADINGAESSDRAPLPVGNTAPTVQWDGDSLGGHQFVRFTSEGVPVFRKLISLPSLVVADEDGDPLLTELFIGPESAAEGVRLVKEGTEYFLEGTGIEFIGRVHDVTVRVTDPWSATAEITAPVWVTNRPPIVVAPGSDRVFASGRECATHSCCALKSMDGCTATATARVATRWGGQSGPLRSSEDVRVVDPDGDPVRLEVAFDRVTRATAEVLGDGGWAQTALIECDVSGSEAHCPFEVRLLGQAEWGWATCTLPQGTNLEAHADLVVRAIDDLGALSEIHRWTWEAKDDPQEGSCP